MLIQPKKSYQSRPDFLAPAPNSMGDLPIMTAKIKGTNVIDILAVYENFSTCRPMSGWRN